jgi:hypothetical protein
MRTVVGSGVARIYNYGGPLSKKFFSHYKFNMSVHKYKTQLKKRAYRAHKIDECNFLNIELKYYVPIIVEEQYVTTSSYFCQAYAF